MVKIVNLNKRTNSRDEAFNKDPNRERVFGGFTGPNPSQPNRFDPNENQLFKAFKSNPEQEGFYKMFGNEDATERQQIIDDLSRSTENTLPEGNNQFAQDFLAKYSLDFKYEGAPATAEEKGLIEPDRIVRPQNLTQLGSTPAASANATIDANTAGKFPSNEVSV